VTPTGSWNFDELLQLGREAGQSLQAEGQPGQLQQAASLLKTVGAAKSAVTGNPFVSVQMITQATVDLHKTVERERTRRAEIEADRQTALTQIEATRFLIHEYMTRTFDERRGTLDRMFLSLQEAQASGNDVLAQQLLGSIVNIVKTSPFRDMASFKKSYEDPEFTLEL
jgi:hypothetical protein